MYVGRMENEKNLIPGKHKLTVDEQSKSGIKSAEVRRYQKILSGLAGMGQFRTVRIDGELWFVGKDVAEALGYANTRDAISTHVEQEDKKVIQKSEIATLEIPNRGMTVINESGLYAIIFGSKLESAKRFKHWVTSEVLPSVRGNGAYIAGQENMTPEQIMAAGLQVAQKIVASKNQRIKT